jgi:two-component system cell cycle response regulator
MSARILVVDDTPANVKLLADRLNSEYYNVTTATNGPDALSIARGQPQDLILLDVMMPGMDGFEVCRQLKADGTTAHVPVVLVTALSDVQDRVRGLEAGADDFLTKPVHDAALQARIRSLLRLKMAGDELRLRQATAQGLGVDDSGTGTGLVDGRNGTILVVDDNRATAVVLERALAADGHKVFAAFDQAALDTRLAERSYELFIVNLGHRKMDALRLCATLRAVEATRQVPILVLVQDSAQDRLVKALDLGINDYAVMPVDRNEIIARCRSQIRRKRYTDRLRGSIEQGLAMALTDALTGLSNRRYAERHLETLVRRFADGSKPMGVMMVDVDFFKKVNDTYGHGVGDDVLRAIGNRLGGSVRAVDVVARWGGEEFVAILQDAGSTVMRAIAERLRQKVAASPVISHDGVHEVQVTISIGAALLRPGRDDVQSLIQRADEALYRAKGNGRNRVEFADPEAATAG